MKLMKYNLDQLVDAVNRSKSIRECLILLGVKPFGGNYDTFRKAVKVFDINTSHFEGQSLSSKKLKGRRKIIPLEELLVNGSNYQSNKLRIRLLEDGIFPHKCLKCQNTSWLGEPIPLELDHIDGNNRNNLLTNLRLLCPNCHAQTPTYRGRNKKVT